MYAAAYTWFSLLNVCTHPCILSPCCASSQVQCCKEPYFCCSGGGKPSATRWSLNFSSISAHPDCLNLLWLAEVFKGLSKKQKMNTKKQLALVVHLLNPLAPHVHGVGYMMSNVSWIQLAPGACPWDNIQLLPDSKVMLKYLVPSLKAWPSSESKNMEHSHTPFFVGTETEGWRWWRWRPESPPTCYICSSQPWLRALHLLCQDLPVYTQRAETCCVRRHNHLPAAYCCKSHFSRWFSPSL